jgi:hypothetical protein
MGRSGGGRGVERRLVRDVWSAARHVRSGLSRLVGEVGIGRVGMWGRDRGLLRGVRGAVMRRACAVRNVEGDAARFWV